MTTTAHNGSAAGDLAARDADVIAGVEKLRFFPLTIAGGNGSEVTDADGRTLLDFSAAWTAVGLGHGNAAVADAVRDALASGCSASILSATHERAVLLAERLLQMIPGKPDRRVYLGHAGTDANDVALRGCRRATGRQGVIAFSNGYHGGLGLAQGVSGIHVESGGADAAADSVLLTYPSAALTDSEARTHIDQLRRHLQTQTIAAVIVEPIQSDGGIIMPHPEFLPALRQMCTETGTLLVCDEVKAGLGRTGRLLAIEHNDVQPDVVTLGKALGAGLPLSAVVGPASVLDEPAASALMTTTGNGASCAAGLVVLDELDDGSIIDNAAAMGEVLTALINQLRASDRPGARLIDEVRGRGLMQGLQLLPNGTDDALTTSAKAAFRAFELGLVVYPVGDGALELTPPLTISRGECVRGMELLAQALDDVAEGAVSDADIAPYAGW